jgi:hypothetical protein
MLLHYCVALADSLDWARMVVIPASCLSPVAGHPDAPNDYPGRYPHTGRGFLFSAPGNHSCSFPAWRFLAPQVARSLGSGGLWTAICVRHALDGALKCVAAKSKQIQLRPLEMQAAATLRTGTAGPHDESRCSAIHKVKGAQRELAATTSKTWATFVFPQTESVAIFHAHRKS